MPNKNWCSKCKRSFIGGNPTNDSLCSDCASKNCKTIAFQPLKIKPISDIVSRNMNSTCPNCGRKMDEREIDWEKGKCRICVHD